MLRETVTHPRAKRELHNELDDLVHFLLEKGIGNFTILFGFVWGNECHPSTAWLDEEIPLPRLIEKGERTERSGTGVLGKDDPIETVSDLEIRLCKDPDVPTSVIPPHRDGDALYRRSNELGYHPVHLIEQAR